MWLPCTCLKVLVVVLRPSGLTAVPWGCCCRLDSVQVVLRGGLEDPLDKEEELQDQMDSLPYLCRFQYENTCTYVCGLLDPTIEAFSQCEPPPQ